ncbi:MAG: hypothetical protein KKB20_07970 [Proteobacteria bacterium]|nr:hypothetical protein [Pseudomonadota bacterium]
MKVLLIPTLYIICYFLLLIYVWPQIDKPGILGFISVLGGGLVGIVSSFIAAFIGLQRIEKESVTKVKEFASTQALELTKLEIELRLKSNSFQILAAAKIYREFYKALFELYDSKNWPHAIEEHGLLGIYDFTSKIGKG